jgi:probable phosphoglycerate mutase
MTEPATRLVLVRHGQSRAAVDGVAGGPLGCRGLTEMGRDQVRALAVRVAATGELGTVDALLSSTLRRAVETAELLADALGGLAVEPDAALSEMEPGEGDGLGWEEWTRRYGSFDLAADPYRPLSPGGDSWASFGLRAGGALCRVVREHPAATVVVACHGGIVEQSLILGFGLAALTPPGDRAATAPNASLTEWTVRPRPDGRLHWQLVRFADSAHLDRDGRPRPARWRA